MRCRPAGWRPALRARHPRPRPCGPPPASAAARPRRRAAVRCRGGPGRPWRAGWPRVARRAQQGREQGRRAAAGPARWREVPNRGRGGGMYLRPCMSRKEKYRMRSMFITEQGGHEGSSGKAVAGAASRAPRVIVNYPPTHTYTQTRMHGQRTHTPVALPPAPQSAAAALPAATYEPKPHHAPRRGAPRRPAGHPTQLWPPEPVPRPRRTPPGVTRRRPAVQYNTPRAHGQHH